MPKFYLYISEDDYAADKWHTGSFLGLKLTQELAVKTGCTIIHRLHDGKVWRYSEGSWK